jgi:selenocysteine lyase/cysteine desulfurase
MTKRGEEFDIAEVIFDDEEAIVRTVEKLIKPNTKLIIFTHASNVTGQVMPIKLIGEVCKKRGISLAVDAAQTAGILPINMEEMNIDYLAVAPHKGLYAPMGTGILIARKNIPETLIEGGTGTMSFSREQPEELPERLESGTVNVAGILGISAGIDFVNGKTIKRIHEYEIGLMTRLYEGLKKIAGVTVYSANPRLGKTTAVLSFNLRNVPSSTLAEILNKKGIAVRAGLHCAPEAHKRLGTADSGTVRVAPSVFTRKEDIDYLISVIKSI